MKKYNFSNLPSDLVLGTKELLNLLEITESENGIPVFAKRSDSLYIKNVGNAIEIGFNKKCEYFRMLSMLAGDPDLPYHETPRHNSLCYMADQSRNGVYNEKTACLVIKYLASLGYDSMMLYTEDTYEIEGEPYFGYMRGRWSKQRIKDFVAYAENFGIEIIPCIQTLAHLDRMLQWTCYKPLQDCEDIMIVGDKKVHALINKMFETVKECFKSGKINLGLDEAYLLGAGKYLDNNGYRTRYDIMMQHLNDMSNIAKKFSLKPIMWSDMFFSISFGGTYYVKNGEIPQSVIDAVPDNMSLAFWQYCSSDKEMLDHMLTLHKKFGRKVIFAGGLQRWARFTGANEFSKTVETVHIDKCFEHGIYDFIATCWGNDGCEAPDFSMIPTITLYAEKCYKGSVSDKWLESRIENIFKIKETPFKYMSDMDYLPGFEKLDGGRTSYSKMLLYADVLTPMFYKHIDKDLCIPYYKDLADKFSPFLLNKNFGYLFDAMQKLAIVCSYKADLITNIRDSYNAGDKDDLRKLALETVPETIKAVDDLLKALTTQWNKVYRSFGIEVHQIRLGGLKERLRGAADIIMEYLDGKSQNIAELEEKPLYFDCRPEDSSEPLNVYRNKNWKNIVTVNII